MSTVATPPRGKTISTSTRGATNRFPTLDAAPISSGKAPSRASASPSQFFSSWPRFSLRGSLPRIPLRRIFPRASRRRRGRTGWAPTNSVATFSLASYTARAFLCWWPYRVVCGCGTVGLLIGMLAGYAGGWFDKLVNLLLINAFLSFPGILLAIAFAAFLGPGIGKVILALVITGWAGYARLARAQVLKVKELEFILAARSLGASHFRILRLHLLPNILQPILIQATIGLAGAILAESTLSFLGLGVLAPLASWGAMLNDARNHLFDAPHMVIFPALAVMTAVLAFNLLGDAWRDWLDPRTRSQMAALDASR